MRTRTEITIETERVLLVSHTPTHQLFWCESCGGARHMLTLNEIPNSIVGTSSELFQLAESGRLHVNITAGGGLLICPNSPALTTNTVDP